MTASISLFPPISGKEARLWRKALKLNQSDFWGKIFVTQSSGSRHESDELIPANLSTLLRLVYCSEKEALALLTTLRKEKSA